MNGIDAIMRLAPVIPVLVIDEIDYARPIAEALVAGGLCALEVTLRTPVALDAMREMAKVEGAIVGAGTVLNEAELRASLEAGARNILGDFSLLLGQAQRIVRPREKPPDAPLAGTFASEARVACCGRRVVCRTPGHKTPVRGRSEFRHTSPGALRRTHASRAPDETTGRRTRS